MSLALGHGITQGAMSVLRGQKFKTGFISGIAGKVTGAVINNTDLALEDSFTKATIAALIGGIAAQASGGDFVEGAMTAMVVYLWNDFWDNIASKKAGTSGNVNTIEYKKQNLHPVARENQQFTAIAGAGYSFDAGVSQSSEGGLFFASYFDENGEQHFTSGWYLATEGGSGISALGADGALFLTFGVFNTGDYKKALRGRFINIGGSSKLWLGCGVDYIQSIDNFAIRGTTLNIMWGTPSTDFHSRVGYGYSNKF